jgi:hypothetical protein
VTELGASVNAAVDFESHPDGALQGSWYEQSVGVTLSISSPVDNPLFPRVQYSVGEESGTLLCPCSVGEGLMPPSRVLKYHDEAVFVVSFDQPVLGAGLFISDYFNPPPWSNTITLEAFTGPQGTGTSLGVFASTPLNFQLNHLYFMGIASPDNEIRSVVLRDMYSGTHDGILLDQIHFARVPEPSTVILLVTALGALGIARRIGGL